MTRKNRNPRGKFREGPGPQDRGAVKAAQPAVKRSGDNDVPNIYEGWEGDGPYIVLAAQGPYNYGKTAGWCVDFPEDDQCLCDSNKYAPVAFHQDNIVWVKHVSNTNGPEDSFVYQLFLDNHQCFWVANQGSFPEFVASIFPPFEDDDSDDDSDSDDDYDQLDRAAARYEKRHLKRRL